MATRRKRFTPPKHTRRAEQVYAAFIAALLKDRVQATKLIEQRSDKRVELSYDDPNG